jgi:type III restriction enzyme
VLLPSDANNYYRALDLVPSETRAELGTAKIVITNFHAFKAKDRGDADKRTKSILAKGQPSAFVETPDQMVRRVCRENASKSP